MDYFCYYNNFSRYKAVNTVLYGKYPIRTKVKYTIAIPTFKRFDLLKFAVNSAINQKEISDFEVIIIDNDPEDEDIENYILSLNSDKIYYFKNSQNIGMFGNWNRCIELANGKYITILNDDDWLDEYFLFNCDKFLSKNINVCGISWGIKISDERHDKLSKKESVLKKALVLCGRKNKKLSIMDFFLGNISAGSLGVLYETIKLIEIGGFNEEYYPSSDYVLNLKYCNEYLFYKCKKRLGHYRVSQNESSNIGTLSKWVEVDYDIRLFILQKSGKNNKLFLFLNDLMQEHRIYSLKRMWGFNLDVKTKNSILRVLLSKLIAAKKIFNL